MTNTLPHGFDKLAVAWREFQMWTPVKLATVEDDRHYQAMVDFLNNLLDKIGDRETHPLIGLLEIAGCFVREYEESNIDIPGSSQLGTGSHFSTPEPGSACGSRSSPPAPPSWIRIQGRDLLATQTL